MKTARTYTDKPLSLECYLRQLMHLSDDTQLNIEVSIHEVNTDGSITHRASCRLYETWVLFKRNMMRRKVYWHEEKVPTDRRYKTAYCTAILDWT